MRIVSVEREENLTSEMKIKFSKYDELLPLSEMKTSPYQRNKHPPEQIERLALIMKEHGVRHPISISKRTDTIAFGHGRKEAALFNGWMHYPVIYQEFESDQEEYAVVQSDNAIATWSELDIALIQLDMKGLPDLDIYLLGIKDFKFIEETKVDPQCDEDDIPEHVEPNTKLGDIYQLGNHRLMCGDSTSIDAVEKLMNGDKADITFTSPPYNAGCFGYDGGKDKYKGNSDDKSQDDYFDFLTAFTSICLEVSTYVFFNNQFLSGNRYALGKFFGHYHQNIKEVFPWIKNTAPPNVNKGFFTNRFEFFLCLEKNNTKKGFPVEWQGKFHNIIEGHTAAKDNVTEGTHSATMPIYVPEWFIERLPFIKSIYEPFGGSGTTLIASEKTNRKCFMMELDPKYCTIIIERWCKYTGKESYLINEDGTQTAWSEIKALGER